MIGAVSNNYNQLKFHRGHLLIAEDNSVNQKVAQRLVERLGFTADVVSNGQEALDAMNGSSYALVLMDWHMPEMDGLEATRLIRKMEEGRARTPVIAFTAIANQTDLKRLEGAGVDDVIVKPVKLGDMEAMLRKWLPDAFAGE
jgi:two-component system sensor histidine kinase/response regulator